VLILGDNAGETVFDRILISQLDQKIFYAVKSEPILNDALKEDAVNSGLDKVAAIIENGSPRSGTCLPKCSQEFLNLFNSADLVISKGQANFETLVHEKRKIFFLFKVKCKLLSRLHHLPLGEYVLIDNSNLNQR
jgi:damage-control phosphatase, subfamily I